MALTGTSIGVPVAAGVPRTEWSVNTLCDHMVGLFAISRNAPGGTIPDRAKNIVRNCLRAVWDAEDWRWQIAIGTLTVASGDSTITLPQDYRKAATAVVKDVDHGQWLGFTNNVARWQKFDSGFDTDADQHPILATAIYDDGEDSKWILNITPESDDDYSFQFPYLRRCPTDLVVGHVDRKGDDDNILMHMWMHDLWEAHAFWKLQARYGKEVATTQDAKKEYDDMHAKALAVQQDTMPEPAEPNARGYGDELLFPTGIGAGRSESDRMHWRAFG